LKGGSVCSGKGLCRCEETQQDGTGQQQRWCTNPVTTHPRYARFEVHGNFLTLFQGLYERRTTFRRAGGQTVFSPYQS